VDAPSNAKRDVAALELWMDLRDAGTPGIVSSLAMAASLEARCARAASEVCWTAGEILPQQLASTAATDLCINTGTIWILSICPP